MRLKNLQDREIYNCMLTNHANHGHDRTELLSTKCDAPAQLGVVSSPAVLGTVDSGKPQLQLLELLPARWRTSDAFHSQEEWVWAEFPTLSWIYCCYQKMCI